MKVTGSLAETGSNSALPVIGLVGGAAVVAGAGALFVVRRRKAARRRDLGRPFAAAPVTRGKDLSSEGAQVLSP
ncbi:LAETG motif-containing sortase-dependent surface protein [Streptomyces thermocarboxydus]